MASDLLRVLLIISVVQGGLEALAALTSGSLALGDLQVSAVTTATVAFTTAAAIPADGKISVVFPTGFALTSFASRSNPPSTRDRSVTSLSTTTYTQITGLLTPVANDGTRTVVTTRSGVGVGATVSGLSHALTFQNIVLPTTAGAVGAITVTTQDSSGTTVETVTFTPSLTISECPQACSTVGTCNAGTGVCTCNANYYGDDCATLVPPAFSEALWGDRGGESYSTDWDAVAATQTTTPSTYGSDLAQYCSCDVTVGLCDSNCCCDAECSTNEQALFTECVATTNASDFSIGCIESKYMAYTTTGTTNLSIEENSTHICGKLYNEPEDSHYYMVPVDVNASTDTAWTELPRNHTLSKFEVASRHSTRSIRDIGVFTSGDNIGAAYTRGSTTKTDWWIRYLKLPFAGVSGECEVGSARFMHEKSDNTCRKRLSSLAASCVSILSPAEMLNDVRVFPLYVPPNRIAIWATAMYSRIFPNIAEWTNNGYLYDQFNATQNTYLTLSVDGVASNAVASYSGGTCTGALSSVKYRVTHNGLGNITAIAATVTTVDLVQESDGSVDFEQTFDIEFVLETEASSTQALVPKSGNNNYIVGDPVMAGSLVTNGTKSAVETNVLGLEIQAPAALTGWCDGTKTHTVTVGSSTSSCCIVNLTFAELQARCDNTYQPANYPSQDRIGMFGSADMGRTADWLTLSTPTTPAQTYRTSPNTEISNAPAWDSTTWSCHGIIASTRLTLVTAYQGAYTIPQKKIVKVTQEYERGTWRWTTPNSDSTHDFVQCYHVVNLEHWDNIDDGDYGGTVFNRDVLYPVFLTTWNIDSTISEFLLVSLISLLSFLVVFFIVHGPWKSLREAFSAERVLFMS